ncbi:MAG: ATP-binding cassette domain-containing protein [Actinomycetes bacterium]
MTADSDQAAHSGTTVDAVGLRRRVRGGRVVLDDVSFSARPGEVVAIAGGSGAGKSTLLEALCGLSPADDGTVLFDGVDVAEHRDAFRTSLGWVPQDDTVHLELPLRRSLRYTARLRLPPTSSWDDVDAAVDAAMARLGLTAFADVHVSALSGGQRKRVSIAAELLTRPRVLFLDEPTSGLDPATAASLLQTLRSLADDGATVVLTTHSLQDLGRCDRVLFLARGGRMAFDGPPADALDAFGVTALEDVYARLHDEQAAQQWRAPHVPTAAQPPSSSAAPSTPGAAGALRQCLALTARTAETIARNRLTLAIMIGSPVMVVAMFAVLFRPGAFSPATLDPSSIVMIVFWVAFGSFFFGLTYGLLQVVTERAVVQREHLVGLNLGAYVVSKLLVLLPFVVVVNVVMLAVLRVLDRLPAADLATYASLTLTLALDGSAALALGLLASAAVTNPSQATLTLPMLCFPAVLFSGAILPVNVMAPVGAAISVAMPDRWAFEAIGRDLELRQLFAEGGSPLGPPLLEAYGDAGTAPTATYWATLAGFTLAFLVATLVVLRLRFRSAAR